MTRSWRPRLLDLYCGAGGASRGYADVGFDVVGVDVAPQRRYPFPFIQADALSLDARFLASFDAIHASPPCQAHSALRHAHNAKDHIDLIPATRAMLEAVGRPWVIENVIGAPIQGVLLCGTMFGLGFEDAELRRHRLFETSFPTLAPQCRHRERPVIGVYGGHVRNRKRTIGVYGDYANNRRRASGTSKGQPDFTIAAGRIAMGIDWMTGPELSQSIPPVYAQWIGARMLALLEQEEAA